ncbi:hypothetical protein [Roseateles sp. MS654]|uniref:hypothetical protein n=1 Tax=Roseateles sp. MS654 TaxID=3412685 RepID=UPI003C2EDDC2
MDCEIENVGRIYFCQDGTKWIHGLAIRTSGDLESMLQASCKLAHAARMARMRVVATPQGERAFVVQRWTPTKGWESAK